MLTALIIGIFIGMFIRQSWVDNFKCKQDEK
jgi:uncharacterized protein YneF (UPF0154 family)